jgi:hypothetical protein
LIPFFADYINGATFSRLEPSQVHVANTYLYQYFRRYLLQKAVSVFRWQLPQEWQRTLFLYCLYCDGHVAVVNTDSFGVIPQPCTLGGRGVQYQPTYVLITNPLLQGILQPRIGTQCAVIRIMPDYGGIMDIINYYARQMALCSETLEINLLNSKLSYVFGVPKGGNRKAAAETLKKLFDQIMSGVPAAFVDEELTDRNGKPTWQLFLQDVGQNFIAPDIQEQLRKLECEFAAKVGIPSNLATTKKERVNVEEVSANDVETAVGPSQWLELAREGLETANRLFGLQLSVDWRYEPDVGSDTEPAGDL